MRAALPCARRHRCQRACDVHGPLDLKNGRPDAHVRVRRRGGRVYGAGAAQGGLRAAQLAGQETGARWRSWERITQARRGQGRVAAQRRKQGPSCERKPALGLRARKAQQSTSGARAWNEMERRMKKKSMRNSNIQIRERVSCVRASAQAGSRPMVIHHQAFERQVSGGSGSADGWRSVRAPILQLS